MSPLRSERLDLRALNMDAGEDNDVTLVSADKHKKARLYSINIFILSSYPSLKG